MDNSPYKKEIPFSIQIHNLLESLLKMTPAERDPIVARAIEESERAMAEMEARREVHRRNGTFEG